MILSLLTALGGGLMRLLPEILGLLNKRTDNAHELAMLDRQFQLEEQRAKLRLEEVRYHGDVSQVLAMLEERRAAVGGQMQVIGVRWADALNFLVRPLTTYYMLILYGLAKVAMFAVALGQVDSVWHAVLQVYDAEDRALLTGILSFWFVGRVLDKKS